MKEKHKAKTKHVLCQVFYILSTPFHLKPPSDAERGVYLFFNA